MASETIQHVLLWGLIIIGLMLLGWLVLSSGLLDQLAAAPGVPRSPGR